MLWTWRGFLVVLSGAGSFLVLIMVVLLTKSWVLLGGACASLILNNAVMWLLVSYAEDADKHIRKLDRQAWADEQMRSYPGGWKR